jgi:hypothetical protein
MRRFNQTIRAARMIAPSPLVEEGSSDGRSGLGRERGPGSHQFHPLWRPFSRLRFAQAPSPTQRSCVALGGEGTIIATAVCQTS